MLAANHRAELREPGGRAGRRAGWPNRQLYKKVMFETHFTLESPTYGLYLSLKKEHGFYNVQYTNYAQLGQF